MTNVTTPRAPRAPSANFLRPYKRRTPRPGTGDQADAGKGMYIVHPDLPEEKLFNDKGEYAMFVLKVSAQTPGEAIHKAMQRGYIHARHVSQYFKAVPAV